MINNFNTQIENICIQLDTISKPKHTDSYYHNKYKIIKQIDLLTQSIKDFLTNLNNIKLINKVISFHLLLELLLLINNVKLYERWLFIPKGYHHYKNISIINKNISTLYNKHINCLYLLQVKIMTQNLK